jgi:hypothetical protein
MLHLIVHLAGTFALLFAAALVVVRVRPFDDGGLRMVLLSSACETPCFLGIRPGMTTTSEALDLLRSSPWVGTVEPYEAGSRWTWSGAQPAFAGPAFSRIFRGEITFSEGVVTRITLSTPVRWGDIFYVFGKPDEETYIKSRLPAAQEIFHLASYALHGFTVQTRTSCPLKTPADMWYSTVNIILPFHAIANQNPFGSC